jgi:hypothetical protein
LSRSHGPTMRKTFSSDAINPVVLILVALAELMASSANGQSLTTATIAPTAVDVGNIVIPGGEAQPLITVTNTGTANLSVVLTYPNGDQFPGLDCQIGGTITHVQVLGPGQTCVHALVIRQSLVIPNGFLGQGSSTFLYTLNTSDSPLRVVVTWNAIPNSIATDQTPLIFGPQTIGTASPPQQRTITNGGPLALNLTFGVSASDGPDCGGIFATPLCAREIAEAATSFVFNPGGCNPIPAFGACTVSVQYLPRGLLNSKAVLDIMLPNVVGDALRINLQGQGISAQTVPGTVLSVEYYNPALRRYFVTDAMAEMALLDNGAIPGWMRTGQSFWVYPADGKAPLNTSPVCRLYGPPPGGLDWHFYSASPAECAATRVRFPGVWIVESSDFFNVYLPDAGTGACPTGTTPVYRFVDPRTGDHRYTTDTTLTPFIAQGGWIAEGYGPNAVAMCSPE